MIADDGSVRVWRLADGTSVVPPLDLTESVQAVAIDGNVIVIVPRPTSPSTGQRSRGPCANCCCSRNTTGR